MKRSIALLAGVAMAVVGLAACSSSSNSSTSAEGTSSSVASTTTAAEKIPTLDVVATNNQTDFKFELAESSVPAGLRRIHLTNTGTEEHQAQLVKLNEGVTMQQFGAAATKNPEQALGMVTLVGGPNSIPPKGVQDAVVELTPGQYVFLCFVTSPDGKSHAEKGMVAPLTVTEATGEAASPPKADGTVTMKDFTYALPSDFGHGTYKLVNEGPQPHEMTLIKLAEGKTVDDLKAWMSQNPPQGPPPGTAAGGGAGIAPGQTEWVTLDLAPGNYVALCFIPDKDDGAPHAAHGMVTPFTVS